MAAAAGSARWKVLFKSDWLDRENEAMNQTGWPDRQVILCLLAVLTENNPTHSHGGQTQTGVTGLLIERKITPGSLAVVHESAAGR
jgi:hypothetical protein